MRRSPLDSDFMRLMLRPRVFAVTVTLLTLSLVPFAMIAKARVTKKDKPRVHFTQHMTKQPRFRTQTANPMFADGRAMRAPVEGTVARGELMSDTQFYRGLVDTSWATTIPVPVTDAVMARGRERFNIYCAVCHGLAGEGNGMIAQRADRLAEGTWTPPANLTSDLVRSRPVGQIFNTITNGVRRMPAYGSQIPEADRWAIVAYVRALQRSQHASLEDVPPAFRAALR